MSDASVLRDLPAEVFRPLQRVEFQAMVERGMFDGTHVELVGGVLVEMSPQGPPHVWMIVRLTKLLVSALGDDYDVGVQTPLAVDDISLPEPDFSVLTRGQSGYPEQAALVIEVSASSLAFDLGVKARRYAAAGYPEYWVVDVTSSCIHVHRAPSANGWGRVEVVRDGTLQATAVRQLSLEVPALFAT
ncbi:Uma2 family endonuclease [Euzebya sp.]|uniref:Uma2 family endonuclease n=1 Tax=Euzebya sp. TaxID=1971409 RepID=UPI0035134608